jgi:hypothetical protein
LQAALIAEGGRWLLRDYEALNAANFTVFNKMLRPPFALNAGRVITQVCPNLLREDVQDCSTMDALRFDAWVEF